MRRGSQMLAFGDVPLFAALTIAAVFSSSTPATQSPPQRSELVQLRTENSRTYQNANGTRTTVTSLQARDYRGADGKLHPISTRLVPHGADSVINEAAGFRVAFDKRAGGEFVRIQSAGKRLGMTLEGARPAAATTSGSTVRYRGVAQSASLEYESLANGVKETVVLEGPDAPAAYRFRLNSLGGAKLRAARLPGGAWAITDRGSRFVVEAPWAVDARGAGIKTSGAKLTVTRDGADLILRVALDRAWLDAPGRVFPVKLDPTITIGPPAVGQRQRQLRDVLAVFVLQHEARHERDRGMAHRAALQPPERARRRARHRRRHQAAVGRRLPERRLRQLRRAHDQRAPHDGRLDQSVDGVAAQLRQRRAVLGHARLRRAHRLARLGRDEPGPRLAHRRDPEPRRAAQALERGRQRRRHHAARLQRGARRHLHARRGHAVRARGRVPERRDAALVALRRHRVLGLRGPPQHDPELHAVGEHAPRHAHGHRRHDVRRHVGGTRHALLLQGHGGQPDLERDPRRRCRGRATRRARSSRVRAPRSAICRRGRARTCRISRRSTSAPSPTAWSASTSATSRPTATSPRRRSRSGATGRPAPAAT